MLCIALHCIAALRTALPSPATISFYGFGGKVCFALHRYALHGVAELHKAMHSTAQQLIQMNSTLLTSWQQLCQKRQNVSTECKQLFADTASIVGIVVGQKAPQVLQAIQFPKVFPFSKPVVHDR